MGAEVTTGVPEDEQPGASGLAGRRSAQARAALDALVLTLDDCVKDLQDARSRADDLRAQLDAGRTWLDIVTAEPRPLIVERLTRTLEALSDTGSRWRRAEALALRA